jgi:competence protein ComEA
MREWIMAYLVVSKKERLGGVLLAVLIASIWILPRLFQKEEPDPEILSLADSVIARQGSSKNLVLSVLQFKEFDPNTAGDETWINMGLSERNVQTIRRFQSKGGYFRVKEDLGKLYGVRPDLVAKMLPYVKIKQGIKSPQFRKATTFPRFETSRKLYEPYKRKTRSIIDLSTADSSTLESLPGIGPALSRRIIQFRNRCGGFYSLDQLAEVYGLQDSVYQVIRPMVLLSPVPVRKMPVNELSIDSLAVHPYISYSEARAIVKYRQQHGPFANESELLRVELLSETWLRKVGPYLQFN